MTQETETDVVVQSSSSADTQPNNVAFFSVELFTNQKGLQIPGDPLNVPGNIDSDQLNQLVSQLNADNQSAGDNDEDNALYDFLINELLLRVTLEEFVQRHELSSESVIKVECVRRQPPPRPLHTLPAHDWVAGLALTTTGIYGACYDGCVRVWDRQRGHERHKVIVSEQPVTNVVQLPYTNTGCYEHILVAGHDQLLTQYAIHTKSNACERLVTYHGHERSVQSLACNKEATRIASGAFDGHLKIWNAELDSQSLVSGAPAAKNKKKDTQKTVTKMSPMVTLAGHRESVSAVCWSPENQAECITASFDQTIVVWDLQLAGQKSSLSGSRAFTSLSVCNSSPNLLLTGSVDKHVRLWDTRNKDGSMVRRLFTSHLGWVNAVAWSPTDPNLFVTAGYDGLVKMWDIRSPLACLYDLVTHDDKALTVDWSQAECVASGGCDNTVRTYMHNTIK